MCIRDRPQTELVRDLVECDDKDYIAVNEKKETSVPGIYAVGDCTQTFLRQVVTAAADGAIAATASERYVKEKKQIDSLLTPDAGKVAFVFYDPYDSEQIEQVSALEEKPVSYTHLDVYKRQVVARPDDGHLQVGPVLAAGVDDMAPPVVRLPHEGLDPMLVAEVAPRNLHAEDLAFAPQAARGVDLHVDGDDLAGGELQLPAVRLHGLEVAREHLVQLAVRDPHLSPCLLYTSSR